MTFRPLNHFEDDGEEPKHGPLRPEEGLAGSAIALVAVYEGIPTILCCEGGIACLEYLDATPCEGASQASFDGDSALADGMHLVAIELVDDGPGDWPGSRECAPSAVRSRAATAEEWLAHISGDYPWVEPWHVALAKLRAPSSGA